MSARREPVLRFTVRGVPGPQGSKDFKGFSKAGRAILVESSKLVKPWRQDVIVSAVAEMERQSGWRPIDGAVHIVIEFFLARPKSQPKTRRTLPTSAPDLDKLVRATGDALKTAGVYRDDSLVTDITTRKRYVVQDESLGHAWELPGSGAVVSVFTLDDEETWADSPLDLAVSERFPIPTLPPALLEVAGHTERFEADGAYGQLFVIAADATDAKALQVARRVLSLLEKRIGMAEDKRLSQVPALLVIEQGRSRLASVPGKPMSALQDMFAEIAERSAGCLIDVLLADTIADGAPVLTPAMSS